jgi:hypothetical protein
MSTESPFPGMDPYVEARGLWKGIHTQLIGELSTHLLPPLLAPAYYVDVEPSLQVRSEQSHYPDLQVVMADTSRPGRPSGSGLPIAEPTATLMIEEQEEEEEENAIAVRTVGNERLVTVIEILSYSNKTSGAEKRARYLLKRRELLHSGVNLVEIDLLRWGQRIVSALPAQPYHILVSRAEERPRIYVWSFAIDAPIPDAPLPLLEVDEQVPLPLQQAFTTVYQSRRFRQRLNYQTDPPPPLTSAQLAYVRACLVDEGILR